MGCLEYLCGPSPVTKSLLGSWPSWNATLSLRSHLPCSRSLIHSRQRHRFLLRFPIGDLLRAPSPRHAAAGASRRGGEVRLFVRGALALSAFHPLYLFGNAAANSWHLHVNCLYFFRRFRRPSLDPAGIRLHWWCFWISQAGFVRGKRRGYPTATLMCLHLICNLLYSTTQSVRHQILSRHLLCCAAA